MQRRHDLRAQLSAKYGVDLMKKDRDVSVPIKSSPPEKTSWWTRSKKSADVSQTTATTTASTKIGSGKTPPLSPAEADWPLNYSPTKADSEIFINPSNAYAFNVLSTEIVSEGGTQVSQPDSSPAWSPGMQGTPEMTPAWTQNSAGLSPAY